MPMTSTSSRRAVTSGAEAASFVPNALAAIAAIEMDDLAGLWMRDRSVNLYEAVGSSWTSQPSPKLRAVGSFGLFLHPTTTPPF